MHRRCVGPASEGRDASTSIGEAARMSDGRIDDASGLRRRGRDASTSIGDTLRTSDASTMRRTGRCEEPTGLLGDRGRGRRGRERPTRLRRSRGAEKKVGGRTSGARGGWGEGREIGGGGGGEGTSHQIRLPADLKRNAQPASSDGQVERPLERASAILAMLSPKALG